MSEGHNLDYSTRQEHSNTLLAPFQCAGGRPVAVDTADTNRKQSGELMTSKVLNIPDVCTADKLPAFLSVTRLQDSRSDATAVSGSRLRQFGAAAPTTGSCQKIGIQVRSIFAKDKRAGNGVIAGKVYEPDIAAAAGSRRRCREPPPRQEVYAARAGASRRFWSLLLPWWWSAASTRHRRAFLRPNASRRSSPYSSASSSRPLHSCWPVRLYPALLQYL